jgi:hypothetical protein
MLEAVLTQLLSPMSIVPPSILFNIKLYSDTIPAKELEGLSMEAVDMASGNLFQITVTSSLAEVMYDAHIILMLEDMSRRLEDETSDWLNRVEWSVLRYSEPMNQVAGDNCRLLIGGDGPQCYIAEVGTTKSYFMLFRLMVNNIYVRIKV